MNLIRGIITINILLIWTYIIIKQIENKDLKFQIKLLCSLLISWILIRIIKCEINFPDVITRYLWYLYYFPTLFSASIFLNIGTWHNKNKRWVKNTKVFSLIASFVLFLCVLTNDFHSLVFKIDMSSNNWAANYTYGIIYYICFVFIFLNILISIFCATKYSSRAYKWQKIYVLSLMFGLVIFFAIGYIVKNPVIFDLDFTVFYSLLYMMALIIIVFGENYRLLFEEKLYKEIEDGIKDRTIKINKLITKIEDSNDVKKDLSIIKLLISYCKNKSNLIVIKKDKNYITSSELKLLVEHILSDTQIFGINSCINIVNKFDISILNTSIIYDYIYYLFEYLLNLEELDCNKNVLFCIQKSSSFFELNTIVDYENSTKNLDNFCFDFRLDKILKDENIQVKIENMDCLSIKLKMPINIILDENNLTKVQKNALLKIKSKVHDILGQRLSVVSKMLEQEITKEKVLEIKPLLINILNDLDNEKYPSPNEMLNQIKYSSNLAGTNVFVTGSFPNNYIKAITMVKIIRECTTNAIRHAKAKNVYITINTDKNIEMIISNDGKKVTSYVEGDGIKGIRNRVKELDGKIEIKPNEDFLIRVVI